LIPEIALNPTPEALDPTPETLIPTPETRNPEPYLHPTPEILNPEPFIIWRRSCRAKRFRGGLVFKAHRLFYHSTLGSRVIKKKKKRCRAGAGAVVAVVKTVQGYLAHKKTPTP